MSKAPPHKEHRMVELSNVLTEKGNLQTAVQKNLKAQAKDYLVSMGFEVMPNGRLAKVIATADGHKVTLNLDYSVGLDTDFAPKAKTAAPKATNEVEVPSLF